MEQNFCQSCGMPVDEGVYGTNADGSRSADYCQYCFENGAFTMDVDMQGMIDFCVPHMVEGNKDMDEAQAREMMRQFFPTLKRWAPAGPR